MAFRVVSSAFQEGGIIPKQYTCDGSDMPPPLAVVDPPAGTQSFAVIMDDPDAPRGTFTHWLAYDMPAGTTDLQGAAGKTLRNSFGRDGYGGPCPPAGHGAHRYFFKVFAVDTPSLTLPGQTRQDLERALETHALGTTRLMGRYERSR